MAYSKWRDKHGYTVDVIHIAHDTTSKVADWGQWLVARNLNGTVLQTTTNHRGWVRTMPELKELGVDLNSLKEIKVHGGSTVFVGEAMLKTARDLNEPGEALDNFEYVRGQAELLVDALGYSQEDAKVAIMAYLAHLIKFDTLMDILYERMPLSTQVAKIIDQAHADYMRAYLKSQGKLPRENEMKWQK